MFLISLALAAAAPPAVKPETVQRRTQRRPSPAAAPIRSKRLVELEATVAALTPADDERGRGGPEGL